MIRVYCLLLVINCIERCVTQSVNVTLEGGLINGQQRTVDGKNVSVFLGIPYAKPPIGELRFKKPVKLEEWSDAIDATKWPNPCVQMPNQSLNADYDAIYRNTNFSEDCLYLNVWSPIDMKNISSIATKAVMFWIHGGGFTDGSSSHFVYDGEMLSAKGDVIVVTINYRLHAFGFFFTGTDDAPGNVGLWDQALALQWVNHNIRYFGGDPQRITIFGESAGSMSVSLHIVSPFTRNLYQNAILMSGAVIQKNDFSIADPSIAKTKWLNAANEIGCSDDNSSNSNNFTEKIIQCLLKTDANTLLSLVNSGITVTPYPIIDGQLIHDYSLNLLRSGEYKKNLNVLIGTFEDEGSFFLTHYDDVKYNWRSPQNLSYNEAVQQLKLFAENIQINGDDMAKIYFNEISNASTNYDLLRRTIGIALGDYIIGCPTILFAKTLYDLDRNGSNVYQYHFKSPIGSAKLFCSAWMGACHGNDLWPVFGLPFTLFNQSSDADREESLRFIGLFSHFAIHGKPSPQYGVDWPQFYTVNDIVIAPYFEYNGASIASRFRNQLKVIECDYLLKKYILLK